MFVKKIQVALLALSVSLVYVSCEEHPPSRDQIPVIKDQISALEGFYLGTWSGEPDSLMTQEFYADMGERGRWQALIVEDEIWPFIGFRNRSFSYSKTDGTAELRFLYRSPDSAMGSMVDSLVPVQIILKHANEIWKIDDVQAIKPIVY